MEWFNRFLNGIKDRAGRKRGIRGRGGQRERDGKGRRAPRPSPVAPARFSQAAHPGGHETPGREAKESLIRRAEAPTLVFVRGRFLANRARLRERARGTERQCPLDRPRHKAGTGHAQTAGWKLGKESSNAKRHRAACVLTSPFAGRALPHPQRGSPRTTRNHGKEPGSLVQEAAPETIRRYGASRNPFRHAPRRGFGTARRRPRRRSRSAR